LCAAEAITRWSNVSLVATAVGTCLLALFAAVAGLVARSQLKAAKIARQVDVLSFYYTWFRGREAVAARDVIRREAVRNPPADRFRNLSADEKRLLDSYLGHAEFVAILACTGVADADLLQRVMGRFAFEAWSDCLVLIARRRRNRTERRAHYCHHLQLMLEEWTTSKKWAAWRDRCEITQGSLPKLSEPP
jgi:hypothetical protein